MNNTPEADRAERMAYSQEYMVDTEVARKLERERDEAREKYATEATEHMLAINKICGERDEAREEAHRFRSLYYSRSGINKSASAFPWEDAK